MLLDKPISDNYKLQLLKFERTTISCKNKAYSHELRKYILQNNFDQSDLFWLVEQYPFKNAEFNQVVVISVIKNLQLVLNERMKANNSLVERLCEENAVDVDEKLKLVALNLENLGKGMVKKILQNLECQNYINALNGKNPVFEKTEANEWMLEAMKTQGWISNYKEDSKDSSKYRAYGRKKNLVRTSI